MHTQSVADVRAMIRGITLEQTGQQIRLGNPPQLLEVDARTGKRLEDVDKKTMVLFGTVLAAGAMRQVELELAGAITRSTTRRTGRLADVASSWGWLYVPKKGGARWVTAATPPATFGAGDALVLCPKELPYATITDRNVGRAGRLKATARKGRTPKPSLQNKGFLYTTAANVAKRTVFKQFSVRFALTNDYRIRGELSWATGVIVIRPRVRRVRV
jgi:hypothetical protein